MLIMTEESANIIDIAKSLPVEMRIEIVEGLLESLNPSIKSVDDLWLPIIRRRIEDVETGKVKPIPGDVVRAKVRALFDK